MPRMSFKVQGLDALIKAVAAVEPKYLRPAVKAGVADATRLILWEARANLKANGSLRTRALYRSLGRRVRVYRNSQVVYGVVGPRVDTLGTFSRSGRLKAGKLFSATVGGKRGGRTRRVVPAWYAHLVEFGTAPHSLTKGAKLRSGKRGSLRQGRKMHPGAKPNPFLRPAFETTKSRALALIRKRVAEAIRKANANRG